MLIHYWFVVCMFLSRTKPMYFILLIGILLQLLYHLYWLSQSLYYYVISLCLSYYIDHCYYDMDLYIKLLLSWQKHDFNYAYFLLINVHYKDQATCVELTHIWKREHTWSSVLFVTSRVKDTSNSLTSDNAL